MASASKKGVVGGVCAVMTIIGLVVSNGNVRTNQAGLEVIGNAEGCRTEPYKCPADVWTDGVGNTHGVVPGKSKTIEQIAADWEKNILQAEKCVDTSFNGRKMNENQFSAMTSAAFNMGCTSLSKNKDGSMTRIRSSALSGNFVQMCNQLPAWVNAGGIKLNGLVIRRDKEKALCLSAPK